MLTKCVKDKEDDDDMKDATGGLSLLSARGWQISSYLGSSLICSALHMIIILWYWMMIMMEIILLMVVLMIMWDFLLSRVIFDLLCFSDDDNIMTWYDGNGDDGNGLVDGGDGIQFMLIFSFKNNPRHFQYRFHHNSQRFRFLNFKIIPLGLWRKRDTTKKNAFHWPKLVPERSFYGLFVTCPGARKKSWDHFYKLKKSLFWQGLMIWFWN